MYGTASTVRRFLLIEYAGPWGRDALRDCRLPIDVTAWIRLRSRELGIRPLLIRRPGRVPSDGVTVFAAAVDQHGGWLERTRLDSARDLLALDLRPLSEGSSVGLTPTSEPLFLVCTHGRHDVCCAEKGRPIAAALSVQEPEATWEVSHIGGDRFAGNLLVLPEGLYYGRLDPAQVVAVAAQHRAGTLSLPHLRGRSCYPFDVQAADWYLRGHLDAQGLRDLTWLSRVHTDDLTTVEFEDPNQARWSVVVRRTEGPLAKLTCSSDGESLTPHFELADVHRIGQSE